MTAVNTEKLLPDIPEPQPLHATNPKFIATLPAGSQLLTIGLRIILVAPGWPPSEVTPSGLHPLSTWEDFSIQQPDGSLEKLW